MIQVIFLIFILILPIFGKSLDFTESIFFYGFSLLFFFNFFFKKEYPNLKRKNIVILIILTILSLISTATSKNIGLSYYQFFVYLNIIFLFLFAIKFIEPKKIEIGLIVSSLIYCSIFLLNKIGLLPLAVKPFSDNFILQIWGHSYLADFLIFPIPILINFLSFENEKEKKYLLFIALFAILISLFLTNSRSALLSLIAGLFFLKTEKPSQKIIKKIIFIGIILSLFISSTLIIKNKIDNKTFSGDREKYFKSAMIGFSKSPLWGNGLGSFSFINKKFQKEPVVNTFISHNSIATFLAENGIIFTLIFFTSIIFALKKSYIQNNLFFICSIISIFHSFLDPTWKSPGIFVISLYFIFFYSLQKQKIIQNQKFSKNFFLICSTILLLFFFSKTISDLLFLRGNFKQSLLFDPFNLNSRISTLKKESPNSEIWQKNLIFSLIYFKNNDLLYETLIKRLPLPQSESYYWKLFELDPQKNLKNFIDLTNFYNSNGKSFKTENVLKQLDNQSIDKIYYEQKIILSKIYYNYALNIFKINPQKSITYFEKTVLLMPTLGHFQIDLANAYWHTNQKEKAINQLQKCLKYAASKKHCQDYLSEYENKKFNQPGQKDFVNHINNELK